MAIKHSVLAVALYWLTPAQSFQLKPMSPKNRISLSSINHVIRKAAVVSTNEAAETRPKRGWKKLKRIFRRGKSEQPVHMQTPSALHPRTVQARNLACWSPENTPAIDDFLVHPDESVDRPHHTQGKRIKALEPFEQPYVVPEPNWGKSKSISDRYFASLFPALRQILLKEKSIEEKPDSIAPLAKVLRTKSRTVLFELLDRWSLGAHINMQVQCDPQGSLLDIVRQGVFCCNASVDVDRIVFGAIRLSGCRLEAKSMSLNLHRLIRPSQRNIKRFPRAFDFVANNATFTQADLFESSCVTNGLRRLVVRILKGRGLEPANVFMDAIKILPNGKLSCQGHATTIFDAAVPFEVRTHIETSCRGHILNFPGLQMSVGPTTGVFLPVIPDVSLDLGHNAQVLDINLDGAKAQLIMSARVTIAPEHTRKLQNYTQRANAYGALFSVDLGRWLTRVGRFSK
jgi:hypothetical protein